MLLVTPRAEDKVFRLLTVDIGGFLLRGNIGILSPDVNRDAFSIFTFVKGHSNFCFQYILLCLKATDYGLEFVTARQYSLLFIVIISDGND